MEKGREKGRGREREDTFRETHRDKEKCSETEKLFTERKRESRRENVHKVGKEVSVTLLSSQQLLLITEHNSMSGAELQVQNPSFC